MDLSLQKIKKLKTPKNASIKGGAKYSVPGAKLTVYGVTAPTREPLFLVLINQEASEDNDAHEYFEYWSLTDVTNSGPNGPIMTSLFDYAVDNKFITQTKAKEILANIEASAKEQVDRAATYYGDLLANLKDTMPEAYDKVIESLTDSKSKE